MNKFFDFIKENFLGILLFIFLIGFIGLVFIGEYRFFIEEENSIEKECFNFYKENNYILEECSKFENKLKGRKSK